ncbi:hypothetical protein K505DRAFT_361447 [Melanomma pulvis-pyrius CBS 109.77]|uniref:Uncharacterized protein n=1 Tax=Melanomma pulvis-pyrius CBS 109.77 TaxID=1314802 RepID=A0A6A6XEB2_9PLEO|nr:hypothetical protein K505DRAFT_361447 [Melanomma pulvis-pyrius CBS 109.77]
MARAGRLRVRFKASTMKKGQQSDAIVKEPSPQTGGDVAKYTENVNASKDIVDQPNILAQIDEPADLGSKSQSIRASTQPPRDISRSPSIRVRTGSLTHHPSLNEPIGNITRTKLSSIGSKSSVGTSTAKSPETDVKKSANKTAAESSTGSKAPALHVRRQVNGRRKKSQASGRLRVNLEVPVDSSLRQSLSPAFTRDEEDSEDLEEIFQFSETLEQRANQKSFHAIGALTEDEVVRKSKHARKVSLKKRKAHPTIMPTTIAQPEIPLDLHPGPILPQYVDIKPAPAHELGGHAFVAKDTFAPEMTVRGFEAPNSTLSAKKRNPKVNPAGTEFFVVSQEYVCENDVAVYNRAAHLIPHRSTFMGLDGAGDEEDEQHAGPRTNSPGLPSALDDSDDQEAEETTLRASQIAKGSPPASVFVCRRRGVSFASSLRFFNGRGVADDEEAALRATRTVTTSGTATPTRRRRALTLLLGPRGCHGSLSAIREDDQNKTLDQLNLGGTDFNSKRTDNQDEVVQPVILQHRHPASEIPRTKTPERYQRSWAELRDPFEKLRRDIEIEREQYEPDEIRKPHRLVLTDAEPPQDSPSVKQQPPSSPSKRRKSSTGLIPSLSRAATYESMQVDFQMIYLTPQEEIPNYPQAGSVNYYKALSKRPMFVFDSHGYLVCSNVTAKMVELFESFQTAPTWASKIPDIKNHRVMKQESLKSTFGGKGKGKAKTPEIDLATDPWIHYWKTLIIKADIRRGCKLAMRAAEDLAREKEADFHDYMGRK